ncbi:UV excision repair protein RAD23 homolog B [Drosophila eugracilis]|uniref:UV excision repair protein RAD23 homolog B n=1 Tax=Drosophila eugracilis TaxID=29029 RepID=UPI0007E73D75|nr:UV excision repair protein RAD23 homolog B [Drosophila eugracilis]
MKLSIRMLDQRTINVEISESQNVRALKQRLGNLPEVSLSVESLQLIYGGRIMEDALPISEYRISEDKFIVLMGKKKVEVKPPEEQVQTTPPQTNVETETRTQVVAPSSSPDEQRVRDLMAMGYGEEEVRSALRASFNHPERAIEYLISGIPHEASAEQSLAPVSSGETTEEVQQLMGDPSVARVREMIRENPELLQLILARLAETDPAAFETVQNNQEEFRAMLTGDGSVVSDDSEAGATLQVSLTAEEAAAVERLEALGFHRVLAVQAYLACDKNEQLAAEILFRQSEEDQDE